MESITVIDTLSQLVDFAGVAVIIGGILFASSRCIVNSVQTNDYGKSFVLYRRDFARIILLGLEFLIAGDIIRSVAETPNLEKVIILAIIVLIRTFLSIELQMEIDGKLPWQRKKNV
jgi:uncharacterized membrane protein